MARVLVLRFKEELSRMICHNCYRAERVREVPKEVQYLTLTKIGRNSLREWKANQSFFWHSREQYTTFEIYIVKLNGTVQIWVGSGFALRNEENGKGQSRDLKLRGSGETKGIGILSKEWGAMWGRDHDSKRPGMKFHSVSFPDLAGKEQVSSHKQQIAYARCQSVGSVTIISYSRGGCNATCITRSLFGKSTLPSDANPKAL
ncbi:hypothetical protein EV359DRAFT_66586 [Lentinula novae-zelandiae]|nr:hypothetical protein EV359DRAFT_66586 [Lentinula novae-zelandiae]